MWCRWGRRTWRCRGGCRCRGPRCSPPRSSGTSSQTTRWQSCTSGCPAPRSSRAELGCPEIFLQLLINIFYPSEIHLHILVFRLIPPQVIVCPLLKITTVKKLLYSWNFSRVLTYWHFIHRQTRWWDVRCVLLQLNVNVRCLAVGCFKILVLRWF